MERMYDKMLRVSQARKDELPAKQERYSQSSKDKLAAVLERKFQTTFIGALSIFEELFGFLWGHGKEVGQLTAQEKEFRKKWEEVRTLVLNNGNNQYRAVINELQQYIVTWQGYHMQLPVKE
jgi:hypothetical protein